MYILYNMIIIRSIPERGLAFEVNGVDERIYSTSVVEQGKWNTIFQHTDSFWWESSKIVTRKTLLNYDPS